VYKAESFQVFTVNLVLVLLNVEIHLIGLPLLERNHKDPGTKHILGVILYETRKAFPKKD
jgi:hypothetical protein